MFVLYSQQKSTHSGVSYYKMGYLNLVGTGFTPSRFIAEVIYKSSDEEYRFWDGGAQQEWGTEEKNHKHAHLYIPKQ